MKSFLLFLCFLACLMSNAQLEMFQFKIVETSDSSGKFYMDKLMSDRASLYEDEKYLITGSCSGEWGGTVKFRNKSTGAEFVCASTCPVAVNYVSGKYIITNTLAHLEGFSEILEVANPEKLMRFVSTKPAQSGKPVVRMAGDGESKSTIGTKVLASANTIITLATFQLKDNLYHIITNDKGTFVATVVNSQFSSIQKLLDYPIAGYDPIVLKSSEAETYVFFKGMSPGYLQITGNMITFYKFPS